jgi:hypothetical protein
MVEAIARLLYPDGIEVDFDQGVEQAFVEARSSG